MGVWQIVLGFDKKFMGWQKLWGWEKCFGGLANLWERVGKCFGDLVKSLGFS